MEDGVRLMGWKQGANMGDGGGLTNSGPLVLGSCVEGGAVQGKKEWGGQQLGATSHEMHGHSRGIGLVNGTSAEKSIRVRRTISAVLRVLLSTVRTDRLGLNFLSSSPIVAIIYFTRRFLRSSL